MSDHAVEHDYHLVEPSPWPFLSGVAALVWGLGMVVFFKGLYSPDGDQISAMAKFFFAKGSWFFLISGLVLAAYVMIGWWRDVIKEGDAGDHKPVVQIGLRYGMIMFLMQEVMFFVAWFWMFFEIVLFHKFRAGWNKDILESADAYKEGYGVNEGGHAITTVNPWDIPLLNTLVLLLSGTTVTWAHHAFIKGRRKEAGFGLGLTILLGLFFTFLQIVEYVKEYSHKSTEGFWLDSNIYGSTFFLATGFHGFHVILGTIFLFVIWLRVKAGGMKKDQHFGFEAAAWYWHFVDVVWIFLFVFVYIVFAYNPAG